MKSFPQLSSRDKFKEDGSTDWGSKSLVMWGSLITNSLWQIKKCKGERFTLGQKESISVSILINLAGSIESFTKAMLYQYLTSEPDIIRANPNIRKFLQASVENHPFPKLISLFPTIVGSNFSEIISCSKDISILMSIRNRLIHGQTPSIAYNKLTKEKIFSSDYKEICEYLYENVDIPEVESKSGYHIEFLCFNVVDHFLDILPDYLNSFISIFSVSFVKENVEKQIGDIVNKINNRDRFNI